MKAIPLIFLFFSSIALSKERCNLDSIGLDQESQTAEKLFYTGTCHFRNKDYDLSVENWLKLASLENIDPEYQDLQIDVLNNLGYMRFFGYGIEKDQWAAIEYWKQAILMGHEEAEYHLCHAYADRDEPTYTLPRARKHCKKALLIYSGMEDPDEEILEGIKSYLAQLDRTDS